MTQEWTELKTAREWLEAVERGDEVQFKSSDTCSYTWVTQTRIWYEENYQYRSRPRKKVKKIVLREALYRQQNQFATSWVSDKHVFTTFVRWLDTPERIVEIEE